MELEQKIKKLEIKKFLVVDDMLKNIEAAQNYFNTLENVKVNYAKSAEEAIEKIRTAYPNESYDFIISDLEMETKKSGIDVAREGYKHQSQVFVATSFAGDGVHEASVHIHPYLGEIEGGRKNYSEVWKIIGGRVINHINSKGKDVYDSFKRYKKYVGKPMENIGETFSKCLEQIIF